MEKTVRVRSSRIRIREIWKTIPGFPGYKASSLGRIKSYLTKTDKRCHTCHRTMLGSKIGNVGRILNPMKQYDGYYRVCLYKDKMPFSRPVNRLILETFVGGAPRTMDAAHLNGKRADNRLVNLKWCTRSENHSHKILHGTRQAGLKHPRCKINIFDIDIIRSKLKEGWAEYRISKFYGYPRTAVNAIAKNKWKIPI